MRQHDEFAFGHVSIGSLDGELAKWEGFHKLADARPKRFEFGVAERVKGRIETPQVARREEVNDECEARPFLSSEALADRARF